MARRKWLSFFLICSGIILALLGALLVGSYVWEAFISRIGDADQSLLFWYLPILFIGVLLAGGGVALIAIGAKCLKG